MIPRLDHLPARHRAGSDCSRSLSPWRLPRSWRWVGWRSSSTSWSANKRRKTPSSASWAAKSAGRSDDQLAKARDYQRKAQFYLDFIEAENSMGFQAPQEAARILGESIDFTRMGQNSLRQ